MRHTRALQRQTDGKWDMAVTAGGHTFATGFCAGKLVAYGAPAVADGDYHVCGHDTKEEAEACYRRYLAGRATFGMYPDVQMRCRVCQAWTQHHAQVEGVVWTLCPEHHSFEDVLAQVDTRSMERWES